MSLQLITGSANAGKTGAIHQAIRAATADRLPVALLLPSTRDVSRATATLATAAPIGLRISTLDDFLDELWRQHGDGRAIATPVQRLGIVEESGKLWRPRYVRRAGSSRGMGGLLSKVVERSSESSQWLDPDSFPNGPARDLAEFVILYQQLLSEARLVERAEAHRRVNDLLGQLALPDLIAVDGFTGFTVAQEEFLKGAARRTEVIASLTYDVHAPATAGARALVERLAAVGKVSSLDARDSETHPAELVRIARSLGSVGSSSAPAEGALVLSEAWGRAAEAARIVREVQDAVREGARPGSIAVVFRDVAPWLHALGAAFREAGVDAEFDVRLPFRSTALGRAISLLLQVRTLSHSALMDLLRSPYSPASHDILDDYDAYVRRSGGSASAARALSWMERHELPTARFIRRALRAHAAATTSDLERAWYALVTEMLRRAKEHGAGTSELAVDAAVARVFMQALQGLGAVTEGTADRETLLGVLQQAKVAVDSQDDPEKVQILGAERVRGRSFECVVVGGLTAGEFPRTAHEDSLSDAEVSEVFSRAGVDLSPRSGLDEERLLFYQVVTRATARLILSRQTHDAGGRPVRPSIFLDEVLDLYRDPVSREYFDGEPPVHRLGLDGLAEHPSAPVSLRRELRTRAAAPAVVGESAQVHTARMRASIGSPRLSPAARERVAERERFSASEIETYLQCPFRWCVQRLIQPRELDEALDQAAIGRLGHEMLRRFYEVFPEKTGASRVTPEVLDEALRIYDEVAVACVASMHPATAAEAVACRTTVRRTRGVIEADATLLPGFNPLAHEWSFGMEEDAPESFSGFSLAGRIDRIDSDGTRLVLTDYKSGRIGPEHGVAKFEEQGVVQLPLYAAVAARRIGIPVVAGMYRSLRGGKPRGFVHADVHSNAFVRTDVVEDAEAMNARVAEAVARASQAVDRLRSGDISPEPRGGICPPFCAARSFCAGWRPGRG